MPEGPTGPGGGRARSAGEFAHRLVRARSLRERERLVAALALPPPLMPPVDAHARLRGPYTAGGQVVRGLAARALSSWEELLHAHDIEVRAVAPELRDRVPVRRETLFNATPVAERTRIHSRFRTLRIAHGLADLLRDHLRRLGDAPHCLVVENMHHAEPTDRELFAVLLRRLDPSLLTLVICAAPEPLGEPLDAAAAARADALDGSAAEEPRTAGGDDELARAYVLADGTLDDPAAEAAYERLDPRRRARLHDARADALTAQRDWSLRLGAIPYHRERGGDPAGAGVRALKSALDHCAQQAFHEATADLGRRARALVDPLRDPGLWWEITRLTAVALTLLGRGPQAEELYDEARATSADPGVHRVAAYDMAMLYARHHAPERRDYRRALTWVHTAIAVSSLLPDPQARTFNTIFYRNGEALVRMRLGELPAALRLVDEGLAAMDHDLPAGSHLLDRCSLLANRARLLAMLDRPDEALKAHDALVAVDPDYAEYRFDRGNLLHSLGREDEALADYDTAIRLALPFPEVHYNRAELLGARGDAAAALADLDRVVELDPGFLDAYVNRAGLLAARQDNAAALADVRAGLALDPDNPYLTCVLGQVEMAEGHGAAARRAFDAATRAAPDLPATWACRASLWYARGEPSRAVDDLTRALAIDEDAALRFNRAVAYRAAGRLDEAIGDATRALELRPSDRDCVRLLDELRHGT